MTTEDIRSEDLRKIAEEATIYPILTESVSYPADPGRSGLSAGTAPLSQKVDLTLREILGWRPRNNDPRGFLASLSQSFEIKNVEGHTEWKWRPRTYAAEADLGAITGAQASLYSRARAALDQVLPLLDGLIPLRADHDLEDIEATRSIVQSGLTELVYELGIEGGPRLARVDGYFQDLLGPIANPDSGEVLTDPENVGGQLASLRNVFGLVGARVNTVDEEQNLTNFLLLVDLVNSLWLTWRSQRNFFDRSDSGKAFLGTQLVLLSRNLSVVAESVLEVESAMNSVFLGPEERQTTRLPLSKGEVVFVGELLDWVHRFATEEGPRLLREGGKDGVTLAFRPTIDRLTKLVGDALSVSKNKSDNPTRGFHSSRVQLALAGLKLNLETTQKNARQISRLPAPEIIFVESDPATTGNLSLVETLLTINGKHFQDDAELSLTINGQPSKMTQMIFVTPAMIRAIFDLTNHLPKPPNTTIKGIVKVKNPDGQPAESEVTIFVPAPPVPPNINSVQHEPVTVKDEAKLAKLLVTITGSNFQTGATVGMRLQGKTLPATSPVVTPPSQIKAFFDLTGKFDPASGQDIEGQIIVTNLDNQFDVSDPGKGVIIKPAPKASGPVIADVQPNPVRIGSNLKLVLDITGSNFTRGIKATLTIRNTSVPAKSVSFLKDTLIKASFELKDKALVIQESVIGKVTVINPDKQQDDHEVKIEVIELG